MFGNNPIFVRKKKKVYESGFDKKYAVSNTKLGSGAFADVFYGTIIGGGGCAVKVVKKDKLTKDALAMVFGEIDIWKQLDHENVVRFIEFFEEPGEILIVMEWISGGSLEKYIHTKHFQEHTVQTMMLTLTDALRYCHSKNVMHRDIKPDNILYSSNNMIKITDFNLSVELESVEFGMMKTGAGTVLYMAPELLKGETYNFKIDIWSLGLVCYQLLSGGRFPFKLKSSEPRKGNWAAELKKKYENFHLRFCPSEKWKKRSVLAKNFVAKLLQIQPSVRPDYDAILKNEWLQSHNILNGESRPRGFSGMSMPGSIENSTHFTSEIDTQYDSVVDQMARAEEDVRFGFQKKIRAFGKITAAEKGFVDLATSGNTMTSSTKAKETESDEEEKDPYANAKLQNNDTSISEMSAAGGIYMYLGSENLFST